MLYDNREHYNGKGKYLLISSLSLRFIAFVSLPGDELCTLLEILNNNHGFAF